MACHGTALAMRAAPPRGPLGGEIADNKEYCHVTHTIV